MKDFEEKARQIGSVYVLKRYSQQRPVREPKHSVWRDWGLDVLVDPFVQLPGKQRTRAMDMLRAEQEAVLAVRDWYTRVVMAETQMQPWPQRTTDTFERVLRILMARKSEGATSREIQVATGLGHGAVSGALSQFELAGFVVRLASR